ncbi:type II toxin-antitoxin system RelE/ParE family toxin [Pelagibacterium sp. 26DY04]|uniref:type II toxin-antitoxin system RelE/ParE family toxin n=1 Tax=Pelagibacterium sp. 26DY04 TaxID=2967130 RepID=UPI0028158FFD|nr:type II toxin-antitoxin system RelE/ParE family toxin [Pelagibacterium sp. 26DY04]WMT87567.1 type II toxin-antitoxin system RelE/ParE family toxin [Pelagibacterium sp. 26DY04]
MSVYRVIYSPEADKDLADLYQYLATEASAQIANAYLGRLMDLCETLAHHPYQGVSRPDLRPGIRMLAHRRNVMIAYSVYDDRVDIIGIFSGGRDYSAILQD